MQTLLPTQTDLRPTQADGLPQRSDRSRITSETDRSSFTQILKQTQRSKPPEAAASDDRDGPETASNADRNLGESKPTSTDQPALTRGQPPTDEPTTRPKAPEQEPSTPPDSVEPPAQNDGVFAQELPADSVVSGKANASDDPVQSTNPKTIESTVLPNDRIDAAGVGRSDAPASTPGGPPETAPATSTALEAAPSQISPPVPNETAPALRTGVADDRTSLAVDTRVDAGSSASEADQANIAKGDGVPEPASDSTQSPPKTIVKDDRPLPPSPGPDQSDNGQVSIRSAESAERGVARPEVRSLDIDRAPQNGARLQSPMPQPQPVIAQDSRSDESQSQSQSHSRSDQPDRPTPSAEPTARAPASARAMQIDAAVRVENATGQPATLQLAAPLASLPSSTTASAVQGLPTPTTPTPSAASDPDPFTTRILRGLSATLNQRGGVLTMRLEPPELGQLRIQMTIIQGTVTAEFQTATPQAQALLERSLAVLRSALQGHGLTVERLTVHTVQQANAQATRQDPAEQQTQQEREHADAGKGESRGRRDGDQTDFFFRHPIPRPTNEFTAFDLPPQPTGAD